MSTPETAGQSQPRDYDPRPLTVGEISDIFDSPECQRAMNDPATREGAMEALDRAEACLYEPIP